MDWQRELDNELANPPEKCNGVCGECLLWVEYPHLRKTGVTGREGYRYNLPTDRYVRWDGLCLLDPDDPEPRDMGDDACASKEER